MCGKRLSLFLDAVVARSVLGVAVCEVVEVPGTSATFFNVGTSAQNFFCLLVQNLVPGISSFL